MRFGFHSLQTGNTFRTFSVQPWKTSTLQDGFHSLQTGNTFRTKHIRSSQKINSVRFHSLQTGNTFRTALVTIFSVNSVSFHSLQTGNTFRTWFTQTGEPRHCVSIPFKREILSELDKEKKRWVHRCFCFHSLQTGNTFRTAPPANPVTVKAKIAKTKHQLRGGFFQLQILPKTPLNPYVHYTKHRFLVKETLKQGTVYVLGHFQLTHRSISKRCLCVI